MSNFKENSPPASPPTISENNQPMESDRASNASTTGISRKQVPTMEEFINGCNEEDTMIITGKQRDKFMMTIINASFPRLYTT